MSTLIPRHFHKLFIAPIYIVVFKIQRLMALVIFVIISKIDITVKNNKLEILFPSSIIGNHLFIDNYFFYLDLSFKIKEVRSIKLKILNDQLNSK